MRLRTNASAANDRILRIGPGIDPARLSLTPAEGFLLSRIDGATTWGAIRSFCGLPAGDVDRCIERWVAEGVVILVSGRDGKQPPKVEKPKAPVAPPKPSAKAIDRSEIDASLEIPVEVQERILEFELVLDHPYHEILGVASDADRKQLRKAYFALSRELHPDRFFRRNTGSFGKRLDRIFGKIVEAYELLSDPTARAEIERSLAAAAGQPPPSAPAAAAAAESERAPVEERPEQAPKIQRAPRRPHVFSLHSRMLRERKGRAKRYFEAGMAAYAAGRFTEAAGGVKLAIAFDPWSAIYKEQFVDVQRKAHGERADKLTKEADAALELRDFATALRALEEVIGYRPHNVDLLIRAARLAWATGGDLHQAKEWAMAAVELDGKNAAAHRVLGQVYRAAGLESNARRELETALAINPKDEEAQNELRAMSGRPLGLRWLGGK